jgi:predicted TIM-barrel fold metal-dependent hydrolase
MNKIDIHCHTTKRKINGIKEIPTLSAISNHMAESGIEKTILLATYFPHKGTGITNFRLLNWLNEYDPDREKFDMFGSLDFDHFFYQGLNELEELAAGKYIKGIKLYTCYQHIDLKGDKLKSVLDLAENYVLPVMFHVGYSYSCMSQTGKVAYTDPVSPKSLEPIVNAYPKTNFIFSHMGKPFFGELVDVVKSTNNVYTDMSGIIDEEHEQAELYQCIMEITKFLHECSPKKLLFGTDYPVQTHADSVHMIEEAMRGFHPLDKKDVYYNNAYSLLHKR